MPASAAEQPPPRATRAQEEPLSEAERRWLALDRRASRFTNAAGSIEQEIYELQMRFESAVLPLLEEEAEKASEAARRVKEESGF